ncbi:hypothetical protein SAMN02745227_01272 [Anaerobranca californiensis DSM 14826]|jgi:hypothetical protein|uniref:Uncharacterized protein n=1 Tax=Anaerobranca californiensis DSM 14826 TaxID=1120989 RepID=A0A1M6NXU0_9FIRM|nr:hypothetical protein SAMN02745227_01272 [Anaerobranca californiensis DSM 14826]
MKVYVNEEEKSRGGYIFISLAIPQRVHEKMKKAFVGIAGLGGLGFKLMQELGNLPMQQKQWKWVQKLCW